MINNKANHDFGRELETITKKEKNEYPNYVRHKHVIDILHQISIVLYRNDDMTREFERFFRLSLEPMLLHADIEGKYDVAFNEERKGK